MSCSNCNENNLCDLCRQKESIKLYIRVLSNYFKSNMDNESVKNLHDFFNVPDWKIKDMYKYYKVSPRNINCKWDRKSYNLWNECTAKIYSNPKKYFSNNIKYTRPYICVNCSEYTKHIGYCHNCSNAIVWKVITDNFSKVFNDTKSKFLFDNIFEVAINNNEECTCDRFKEMLFDRNIPVTLETIQTWNLSIDLLKSQKKIYSGSIPKRWECNSDTSFENAAKSISNFLGGLFK